MTSDFDTQLTALLDDVADSITPRADYGAVRAAAGATGGRGRGSIAELHPAGRAPRPFRRGAAVAAAAVLLVAGGAAAIELTGDDTGSVATAPEVSHPEPADEPATIHETDETGETDEPSDIVADGTDADQADADEFDAIDADETDGDEVAPPEFERRAELGPASLHEEPPVQWVHGTAPVGEIVVVSSEFGAAEAESDEGGEWKVALEFPGAEPGTEVAVQVAFAGHDEVVVLIVAIPDRDVDDEPTDKPKDEPSDDKPTDKPDDKPDDKPEEEPTPVAFTAVLGWAEEQAWGMKIGLWGAATPGAVVELGSEYGTGTAVATDKGEWQMIVELEMPPGATAVVTVASSSGDRTHRFTVERPAGEVEVEPFTATAGQSFLDHEPPEQWFHGRGEPGSVVTATSKYGTVETTIAEHREYLVELRFPGAQPGEKIAVRLTNSTSDKAHTFDVKIPVDEEPETVEFTADAAFSECDEAVPFNEYWGTAQPGTVVHIMSPYGSAEKVAGENGSWEARVEFPEAPRESSFVVQVKSVATGQVKEFTMFVGPLPEEGGE